MSDSPRGNTVVSGGLRPLVDIQPTSSKPAESTAVFAEDQAIIIEVLSVSTLTRRQADLECDNDRLHYQEPPATVG